MDFLELAHLTHKDKICLMIFFHGGLSEPLRSIMPLHDPNWTLERYMDTALQLSGSFTVGATQELAESDPGARRVRLSFVSAGPAQLSFVSVGPAQLSFVSAGPAQLAFAAGPAQLSFVSAGPAQLNNASAGSVQFYRVPKRVRAT